MSKGNVTPRRLDVDVKTNGHIYQLFRRSDKVACYKQFDKDGTLVAYELFEIPIRKEEQIKGVTYPFREVFPSTSDFGQSAWSLSIFLSEDKVKERFEKLEKETELKYKKVL